MYSIGGNMEKVSAVYQIKNMVTGNMYIGSSKDVYSRWKSHKKHSMWNKHPNSKLYKDMQEYGLDNFIFAILECVEPEYLRQVEQNFIDMLQPTYNQIRANGFDVERWKAYHKVYQKAYQQSEKNKTYQKVYTHSGKRKAYRNQLCNYNGETLTLNTLSARFFRAGIEHPVLEAKKYLLPSID